MITLVRRDHSLIIGVKSLARALAAEFSEVSIIDQRAALPSRHTPVITARPTAPIGDREFGNARP